MSPSIASIVPPLSSPAVLIVSPPLLQPCLALLHAGRNALLLVLLELFLRVELLAAVTALERLHLLLLVGYARLRSGTIGSDRSLIEQRTCHRPGGAGKDRNYAAHWMKPRPRCGAASVFTCSFLLRPRGFTV